MRPRSLLRSFPLLILLVHAARTPANPPTSGGRCPALVSSIPFAAWKIAGRFLGGGADFLGPVLYGHTKDRVPEEFRLGLLRNLSDVIPETEEQQAEYEYMRAREVVGVKIPFVTDSLLFGDEPRFDARFLGEFRRTKFFSELRDRTLMGAQLAEVDVLLRNVTLMRGTVRLAVAADEDRLGLLAGDVKLSECPVWHRERLDHRRGRGPTELENVLLGRDADDHVERGSTASPYASAELLAKLAAYERGMGHDGGKSGQDHPEAGRVHDKDEGPCMIKVLLLLLLLMTRNFEDPRRDAGTLAIAAWITSLQEYGSGVFHADAGHHEDRFLSHMMRHGEWQLRSHETFAMDIRTK